MTTHIESRARARARLGVAAVAGAFLAGCTPAQNGTAQQQDTRSASVDAAAHVTMERFPCFGTCPVYRVELAADGTVTFEGHRFVEHTGSATAAIAPEAVATLLRSLEADGFFSLAERYTHGEKACGAYHTDAPRVVMTLQLDGRTRTVEHDHGCADAPAALRAMQERVDSVAGVARWVGP